MSRNVVILCLTLLLLPVPAAAQGVAEPGDDQTELEQGADLLERGARLLLRGLMAEMEPALNEMGLALSELEPVLRDLATMIGDIRNYHGPEMMPNGDIILRRKIPLVPEPPAEGEIDL